jgi:hypothetical protein
MGVAAVVVVLAYGLLNLSRHPRQQAISKTMEAGDAPMSVKTSKGKEATAPAL